MIGTKILTNGNTDTDDQVTTITGLFSNSQANYRGVVGSFLKGKIVLVRKKVKLYTHRATIEAFDFGFIKLYLTS